MFRMDENGTTFKVTIGQSSGEKTRDYKHIVGEDGC